jgi:hypothetical protein
VRWTAASFAHRDLTGSEPTAASDPAPCFMPTDGTQHVIYRGDDGHVHELWWTHSIVTRNDLTAPASAPGNAAGDPSVFVSADGACHVVYPSSDGNLRAL